MKYLVLDFQGAKLYSNYKTKDFINSPWLYNGKAKRQEKLMFKEKITVFQISNVIHVLFGERPVPSLRPVLYQRNEKLFQKANQSFLKILNDNLAFNEIGQSKKSHYGSWNTTVYLSWDKIKDLSEDNFNLLIDTLSKFLNINCLRFSFNEIVDKLRELLNAENEKRKSNKDWLKEELVEKFDGTPEDIKDITNLFKFFKSIGLSSIKDYVVGGTDIASINKNKRTFLTVLSGVAEYQTLNGQILVPVTDEEIEYLKKYSKGHATILDGGIVQISKIIDGSELSDEGFTKVENISTETNY